MPAAVIRMCSISLEQLDERAELLRRLDRKYVISDDQLAVLLEQLGDDHDVLEIDDRRSFGRESGDVLHTAADVGRARDELGFDPATPLEEGLRAEYAWVLERAAAAPRVAALRG